MVRDTASPAFIVVSVDDISERAYEIYSARGRLDGLDLDDWLRAERELTAAPTGTSTNGSDNVSSRAKRRRP